MHCFAMQSRVVLGCFPWALLFVIQFVFPLAESQGCSICSSISPTICDEISAAQLVIIARYESTPEVGDDVEDGDAYKSSFQIEKILKGAGLIGTTQNAKMLFFPGDNVQRGDRYLVHGNLIENDDGSQMIIQWTTPIAISSDAIAYLEKMLAFSPQGVERLICAKDYLTSSEKMLRRDAFDEFGKAPFETLLRLRPYLNADQVMSRIENPETPAKMRKLYYTLLCVCGRPEDIPKLKLKIQEAKSQQIDSLPAMIACYLSLAGAEGLPLIEETFLQREEIDQTKFAGAAITALRFHGQEANVIDRELITACFRRMLQRPQLGARVLSDLARWEDWSVVDRTTEIFIDAEGDSLWVREPAVRYLMACPLPEAKTELERLESVDPAAVANGRRFAPLSREATQGVKATRGVSKVNEIPDPGSTLATISPGQEPISVSSGSSVLWVVAVPVAAGVFFMVLLLISYRFRTLKA